MPTDQPRFEQRRQRLHLGEVADARILIARPLDPDDADEWVDTGVTQDRWWDSGWLSWDGLPVGFSTIANVLGVANCPLRMSELTAALADLFGAADPWHAPAWADDQSPQVAQTYFAAAGTGPVDTMADVLRVMSEHGLLLHEFDVLAVDPRVWLNALPPPLWEALPLNERDRCELERAIASPREEADASLTLDALLDRVPDDRPALMRVDVFELAEQLRVDAEEAMSMVKNLLKCYPCVADGDLDHGATEFNVIVDWDELYRRYSFVTVEYQNLDLPFPKEDDDP